MNDFADALDFKPATAAEAYLQQELRRAASLLDRLPNCAECEGRGAVYKLAIGRVGPCLGCGGTGKASS